MPFEVKLPDIGEGIAEGEIVRWLVKAGDVFREDQPLVEVMTDKATVEIPSPRAGTIASLHAEAGSIVPVGSVIVSITLWKDRGNPRRYIVADRWTSEVLYEEFMRAHADAIAALNERSARARVREIPLGRFDLRE